MFGVPWPNAGHPRSRAAKRLILKPQTSSLKPEITVVCS